MQPSKREHASHRKENRKENTAASGEEQRLSRRRQRTRYEPYQVEILKAAFTRNPHPDFEERQRLANELNIGEDRVAVWFQNRRARHGKSAELKARKQTKTRKIPFHRPAPYERVACHRSWPGNSRNRLQPGHHLGQDQPVHQHHYYPFPQGTVNQHETSSFVTGQATSSFGSNVNFGPSVQNLPFGFGGAESHPLTQPQPSQQNNYSWNFSFNYNACSGQEDPQCSSGTQQVRGQACVAQPQGSVSSASGSSLEDIMCYLQEDGGCALNPSSGSSPLFYGAGTQMGREPRPTGTYSYSQSSPSSTAQWPGSSCQWGNLPNQYSSINCQNGQGPLQTALANVTNGQE